MRASSRSRQGCTQSMKADCLYRCQVREVLRCKSGSHRPAGPPIPAASIRIRHQPLPWTPLRRGGHTPCSSSSPALQLLQTLLHAKCLTPGPARHRPTRLRAPLQCSTAQQHQHAPARLRGAGRSPRLPRLPRSTPSRVPLDEKPSCGPS